MAYEKNTWASGDVVTSAKLNHMENGIEAASSSSELPTPTSADVGKVVGVGRIAVPGAVVVAEQTVTTEWVAPYEPEEGSLGEITADMTVVDGQKYIVTVNGTDYIGTGYYNNDGDMGINAQDPADPGFFCGVSRGEDDWFFATASEAGTYTVKVSELAYKYDYELDKYPQYDIVIGAIEINNTLSNYTAIKYNYDDIHQKVLDGELVTGVLYCHWNYDEAVDGDTNIDPLSLGFVHITSNAAFLVFWGYNGNFKKKVTLNIDIDTGEFQSVPASTWS